MLPEAFLGKDLSSNPEMTEFLLIHPIADSVLAKFTHGQAANGESRVLIGRIQNQTADLVVIWIDQRLLDDLTMLELPRLRRSI